MLLRLNEFHRYLMATFAVDPWLMRRRLQPRVGNFAAFLIGSRQNKTERIVVGMKPPNILVYYPKGAQSCGEDFLIAMVEQCIPPSRYVVYGLNHSNAIKDPWMENCQLLIVPSIHKNICDLTDINARVFEEYLSRKGKIINFSKTVMSHFGFKTTTITGPVKRFKSKDKLLHVAMIAEDWGSDIHILSTETNDKHDTVLNGVIKGGDEATFAISQTTKDGGHIVHCSLPLLQICNPINRGKTLNDLTKILMHVLLTNCGLMALTQDSGTQSSIIATPQIEKSLCYLLGVEQGFVQNFLSAMGATETKVHDVTGSPLSLKLLACKDFSRRADICDVEDPSSVPVLYSLNQEFCPPPMKFSWHEYQSNLTSKVFGKLVLYSDLVTSTMDIVEPIVGRLCQTNNMNITCIARQQSKGKGRGGNKWLSPPGTAMLTTAFSIPLQSPLGQNLSIVQHLMTVAVVHAVRSIPGLEGLDLRVKWPNDIYIGNSVKIGGVLVKSTIFRDLCTVTIGCGVNVSNEYPTKCINDAIGAGNFNTDRVTCERVLALSISCLETLVASYQLDGPEEFLNLYYRYWIHSGQNVQVRLYKNGTDTNELINARVTGIDASGFLRVVSVDEKGASGGEMSLQPDSNSFDMTKNLIAMKSCR